MDLLPRCLDVTHELVRGPDELLTLALLHPRSVLIESWADFINLAILFIKLFMLTDLVFDWEGFIIFHLDQDIVPKPVLIDVYRLLLHHLDHSPLHVLL